jgi:hypothetical protein
VRRVVLHPSAFLGWFGSDGARRSLRSEYEAGALDVVVPRSFVADTLAALAAAGWPADRLTRVAVEIGRLGFRSQDPPADALAGWLYRGLDASPAGYAALAEALDVPLAVVDESLRAATAALSRADA